MAYQTESPATWPPGVYQIAVTDPVLGGSDGPPNLMGAALANRTLYQRMRNVTHWSADLAAAYGYPAGACVMHAGVSWRAVVDNNVAPGTDPLKWERWAYSESELAAYLRDSLLSPTTCPATGPAASPSSGSPWTIWKSVAPYNEYWMWLGDAWGVVWNHWSDRVNPTSGSIASGGGFTTVTSWVAPRNGSVNVTASTVMTTPAASGVDVTVAIAVNGEVVSNSDNDAPGHPSARTNSQSCSITSLNVAIGDVVAVRMKSTLAVGTITAGSVCIFGYCK